MDQEQNTVAGLERLLGCPPCRRALLPAAVPASRRLVAEVGLIRSSRVPPADSVCRSTLVKSQLVTQVNRLNREGPTQRVECRASRPIVLIVLIVLIVPPPRQHRLRLCCPQVMVDWLIAITHHRQPCSG